MSMVRGPTPASGTHPARASCGPPTPASGTHPARPSSELSDETSDYIMVARRNLDVQTSVKLTPSRADPASAVDDQAHMARLRPRAHHTLQKDPASAGQARHIT